MSLPFLHFHRFVLISSLTKIGNHVTRLHVYKAILKALIKK